MVKEIRQTLRETADPNPPDRPVEEFLATENKRLHEKNIALQRDSEALTAAYEAAGISGLSDLAHHIQALRGAEKRRMDAEKERDALRLQTRPPLRVDYVEGEGLKISCGEQLVIMPHGVIAATFGWQDAEQNDTSRAATERVIIEASGRTVAERRAMMKLATEVTALLTYLDGRCRSDGSEDAKERAVLDAYGYVRARMRTAMDAMPQHLKEEAGGT
jgi:hypothetical protein